MKEENIVKLLKKNISEINLNPVIYIYGGEDLLKKQFIDKFKSVGSDFHFLWGDEVNLTELKDIFGSASLFSSENVAVLWDMDSFVSKLSKDAVKEFLNFIKGINSPNKLFLVSKKEKVPAKEPFKTISSTATVINSPHLTPKAFELSVYKKIQREGKNISLENLKYLISKLPNNLYNTKQEIEKLLIYTAEKNEITKEDIDAVITTKPQVNIFVFQNQFLKKDINAVSTFQRLVEEGQHPFEIQSFILNLLNKIIYFKDLIDKGTPKQLAFSKVGINYRPQQLAVENASNVWKKSELLNAVKYLYETEKYQKLYYEDVQKKAEEFLLKVLLQ